MSIRKQNRFAVLEEEADTVARRLASVPILSNDVLTIVFSHLNLRELARTMRTSWHWNRVCGDIMLPAGVSWFPGLEDSLIETLYLWVIRAPNLDRRRVRRRISEIAEVQRLQISSRSQTPLKRHVGHISLAATISGANLLRATTSFTSLASLSIRINESTFVAYFHAPPMLTMLNVAFTNRVQTHQENTDIMVQIFQQITTQCRNLQFLKLHHDFHQAQIRSLPVATVSFELLTSLRALDLALHLNISAQDAEAWLFSAPSLESCRIYRMEDHEVDRFWMSYLEKLAIFMSRGVQFPIRYITLNRLPTSPARQVVIDAMKPIPYLRHCMLQLFAIPGTRSEREFLKHPQWTQIIHFDFEAQRKQNRSQSQRCNN